MSALTRKLILLLVVCITAIGAAAQTRTLSGEVVEKSGDPLVGVSVFNREYKIGTTTDIDGKFEITLPSGVKTDFLLYRLSTFGNRFEAWRE